MAGFLAAASTVLMSFEVMVETRSFAAMSATSAPSSAPPAAPPALSVSAISFCQFTSPSFASSIFLS